LSVIVPVTAERRQARSRRVLRLYNAIALGLLRAKALPWRREVAIHRRRAGAAY
jgi:hypothetical protein